MLSHDLVRDLVHDSARNLTGDWFAGFSFAAPALTWTSAVNVAVAVFQIVIPTDVISGYKIHGEASLTSGGVAFDTATAVIAAGDLTDLQIDDFAFAAFPDYTTVYVRVHITDASDVQVSNWSNIVVQTTGFPNYFPARYFAPNYFAQRYFG